MLDVEGENMVLVVRIVVLDAAVHLAQRLLCLLFLANGGTPRRGLGKDEVNDRHETNLTPLSVNGCPEIIRVLFVHGIQSHMGAPCSNPPPEAVAHQQSTSDANGSDFGDVAQDCCLETADTDASKAPTDEPTLPVRGECLSKDAADKNRP